MSKLSKFIIMPYSERPKSVISGNFLKNGYVWATQWLGSIEPKIKFDPSFDRSWSEFFKIIKNHGPKNPPRGVIWVSPGLVPSQKEKWLLSCSVWRLSMPSVKLRRSGKYIHGALSGSITTKMHRSPFSLWKMAVTVMEEKFLNEQKRGKLWSYTCCLFLSSLKSLLAATMGSNLFWIFFSILFLRQLYFQFPSTFLKINKKNLS